MCVTLFTYNKIVDSFHFHGNDTKPICKDSVKYVIYIYLYFIVMEENKIFIVIKFIN